MAGQIWRGPHIDIPPRTTILDLIAKTAARQPERVALVDGISDRTITYVRLVDSIERVASALRAGGAGPGSCLAIYAPNSPEWAIAALAIMRSGGTVTGASPQFKTDELVRHLSLTNAHWLLTVSPLLDIAKEAAAKLGGIEVIVEGDRAEGAISFSELLAGATPADCNTVGQEAPAMLPFSSGTTNLPKPVELTHKALVTAALQAHAAFGFGPDDRLLALAPFYFIAGSAIILFGGLAMGASVVTVPRFQFEAVMDVVERHRISVALLVPPIMRMLAQRPEIEGRDLSHMRLIMCGGAHVSGAIEEGVARRFGATVVQAYGTYRDKRRDYGKPPDSTTTRDLRKAVPACGGTHRRPADRPRPTIDRDRRSMDAGTSAHERVFRGSGGHARGAFRRRVASDRRPRILRRGGVFAPFRAFERPDQGQCLHRRADGIGSPLDDSPRRRRCGGGRPGPREDGRSPGRLCCAATANRAGRTPAVGSRAGCAL
jgi:AMP-binding enzyme